MTLTPPLGPGWGRGGGELAPIGKGRIMSELSNSDRARRGELALTMYGLSVAPHDEDEETLATDLVADLMHALERLGFNPVMAVEMGMEHYYAECAELVGTTSTGAGV